jgi:hypothetical protein
MRDRQVRLYMWLVAYAPRWVIGLIPQAWRFTQLRKILGKVGSVHRTEPHA